MKLKIFLPLAIILGIKTFLFAQNILSPDVCKKTIYDFYSQQAILDSIRICIGDQAKKDSVSNWISIMNKMYNITDSISAYYCTNKIREEAKEWFFEGFDRYTNNGFFDKSALKTLSIEKYDMKLNTYKVSYTYTFYYSYFEQYSDTILVTLVDENGRYLIDEITGIDEE